MKFLLPLIILLISLILIFGYYYFTAEKMLSIVDNKYVETTPELNYYYLFDVSVILPTNNINQLSYITLSDTTNAIIPTKNTNHAKSIVGSTYGPIIITNISTTIGNIMGISLYSYPIINNIIDKIIMKKYINLSDNVGSSYTGGQINLNPQEKIHITNFDNSYMDRIVLHINNYDPLILLISLKNIYTVGIRNIKKGFLTIDFINNTIINNSNNTSII